VHLGCTRLRRLQARAHARLCRARAAPGPQQQRNEPLMATSSTQAGQAGGQTGTKVGSQIGRSLPRLEARDKVTRRAASTHTLRLPGLLSAKVFRSTVAHGPITSIDTTAAKT